MSALLRIVDPHIEGLRQDIDKRRQIGRRTVDAAHGSGDLQRCDQFHQIRRGKLLRQIKRGFRDFDRDRIGDGRITKPGEDQADFEIRQQKRRFEQRRLRRFLLNNPHLQPHQAGLETGKFVQQVEGRAEGSSGKTMKHIDVILIGCIESILLRGQ